MTPAELDAIEAGRIPCSVRLPTNQTPVLGWNTRHHAVWIYAMKGRTSPKWFCVSGDKPIRDITHWMPLPAPPLPNSEGAES